MGRVIIDHLLRLTGVWFDEIMEQIPLTQKLRLCFNIFPQHNNTLLHEIAINTSVP